MSNQFQENFPFISCLKSNDREYVGIIINCDDYVSSMYDLSMIINEKQRVSFLELGEVWWWESNRQIPINIFLRQEISPFKLYIKTFNSKDVRIILGPVVNLMNLSIKRVKRKSVQLVRSPGKR